MQIDKEPIKEPVDRTQEVLRDSAGVWQRYGVDKEVADKTYANLLAVGDTLEQKNRAHSAIEQTLRDAKNELDDAQVDAQEAIRSFHTGLEALVGADSPLVQDLPDLSDHKKKGSTTGGTTGGITSVTSR